jgi:arylsulfatase A-like enzyme
MENKMNVLFIITDAQRQDHLGCYGNSIVKTPHIDKLAKEGIRFTNYYCTNPICMPNRATLLTGLYPNVHGVRSNGMILSENIPTITQTLKKRGWHTVSIGKIHHQFWMAPYKLKYKSAEDIVSWSKDNTKNLLIRNNFPLPYYGYVEVDLVIGNGTVCSGHYIQWLEKEAPDLAQRVKKQCLNYDYLFSLYCDEIPEEYYNTTYVRDRTISFLERFAKGDYGDKPFYLHCSFPDPHYPVNPPKRYKEMYRPEDMILPPNFADIKNLYEHQYLGKHLKDPPFKRAFLRETTEEEIRKITVLTYSSISYLDESIGQILSALEKLGLANNTIIVFSSDHADLMGEHGLLFKGPAPFNGVLQVPLIWKVPELTKLGDVSEALVSSIDLPKTILNLLGIKEKYHPPDMQGFDISQVLADSSKKVRDCCFIENDEEVGPLKSRIRHLVTKDYKLTVYEGYENYGDLYDRHNDPEELNNLWYDPKHNEKRFELLDKLLHENLKAQSRYPRRIAGS